MSLKTQTHFVRDDEGREPVPVAVTGGNGGKGTGNGDEVNRSQVTGAKGPQKKPKKSETDRKKHDPPQEKKRTSAVGCGAGGVGGPKYYIHINKNLLSLYKQKFISYAF